MAVQALEIEEFLHLAAEHLVIDVRSPSEYKHAHIPGAYSLPLFSDEERAVVGTTYKQGSRRKAIKVGLDYFGPRMKQMIIEVEELLKNRNSNTVLVHCWRGGMRSGAVAWLMDLYGIETYQLIGGYKEYRNWVIEQFDRPYHLRVLSGKTGSGKTDILHEMASKGEAVLDLEGLAGHKGSAFGNLGLPEQDGIQQFENKMAMALSELTQMHGPEKPIWLESESNRIGHVQIYHTFFEQMKTAEHVHIEIPIESRLDKIVEEYGKFAKAKLMDAVKRIERRLGGMETKNTLKFLEEGDIRSAFKILLDYYDRLYEKSTLFRDPVLEIDLENTDAMRNAEIILKKSKTLYVG